MVRDPTFAEALGFMNPPSTDIELDSVKIPKSLHSCINRGADYASDEYEDSYQFGMSNIECTSIAIQYGSQYIQDEFDLEQIREVNNAVNEATMRGDDRVHIEALNSRWDTSWEPDKTYIQKYRIRPDRLNLLTHMSRFLSCRYTSTLIRHLIGCAFKHFNEDVYMGFEYESVQPDITRYEEKLTYEVEKRLRYADELGFL